MTTLRFYTWVHDNLFDRDYIKYKLRPDTFGEFEKFENVLRYSLPPPSITPRRYSIKTLFE